MIIDLILFSCKMVTFICRIVLKFGSIRCGSLDNMQSQPDVHTKGRCRSHTLHMHQKQYAMMFNCGIICCRAFLTGSEVPLQPSR